MAQQIFDQYAPLAKVSANETIPVVAAIAQTRDGKDELLHGTVPFVPAGDLYVPVSAANRLPVEATLTGSNLALRQTIVTGAKTVTSTTAEIFAGSSRLAGRHAMVITNVGVGHVYIGASGVTTGNGFPLFPGDTVRLDFDPANSVPVFAVSGGPDVEVRVVELA